MLFFVLIVLQKANVDREKCIKKHIYKHVNKFNVFILQTFQFYSKKLEKNLKNTHKLLVVTDVVSHFERVICYAEVALFDQITMGFGVFFTRQKQCLA